MKIDSFIRILAGCMVLLSVALAHFVSPWWLLLTCMIGVNLIQSVFTGFCPPSLVLRKLGWLDDAGIIHWGGKS
ncbi:MAG: DUF2892 domain-containing protein [Cephaloticoccus sp.]|nr:DUF2892 domain-containing protein [Cephaloticoccus sp.]MCF7760557.1 DUF2892 domain-containing protein [Cephaloticoccus sp.]